MEYLWIDIGAVALPLVLSFDRRLRFYTSWKALFSAIALVAVPFIIWDSLFAKHGIWGFSDPYLIGLKLFHLPLEEWLFFVCIPYACVFTWRCIGLIVKDDQWQRLDIWFTPLLSLVLLTIGMLHTSQWYTAITFLSLGVTLILLKYVLRTPWLMKFYLCYAVLLLPFGLVNGALTGTFGFDPPIVWYNDAETLGIRLGMIPLEDISYGMLLVSLNVALYERFRSKA